MSTFKRLTEKQFPQVAGVWGGPQAIPQLEVDSKGRVIAISEVPTPAFPSLTSALIQGFKLSLDFDQELEPTETGLIAECLIDGQKVDFVEPILVLGKTVEITLSKEVFANQTPLVSLSGFKTKETGLEGKVIKRQARNLGRSPDWVANQTIQELGIGATVLYLEEGFRLISTKLNEGVLSIWSLGSTIAQTQQIAIGTCTGLTPVASLGSHLAIGVGSKLSLLLWDKSCQSFVLKAELEVNAQAVALSSGLLFVVKVGGFEVYDIEGDIPVLIGQFDKAQIRQIHSQSSGYNIALLVNDQVEIWTRRTLTQWAKSSSIPIGSLDSKIAFDGQALVITSIAQETTQVWARVANSWTKSAKWAIGGAWAYIRENTIAIGDERRNKVTIIDKPNYSIWPNAKNQTLGPGSGIREDFGQSVAIGPDFIAVGSPQSSTIRLFIKEGK